MTLEHHSNNVVLVLFAVMAARSYTVVHKLKVLGWYHANGENKHTTASHFQVDRKRINDWIKKEVNLQQL